MLLYIQIIDEPHDYYDFLAEEGEEGWNDEEEDDDGNWNNQV